MKITPALMDPLLQSLRDLLAEYERCADCAGDLIASLVAGDPSAVQVAVAAQTAAFSQLEAVERHRRQAELALARTLCGRERAGLPVGKLTTTALVALLPPDDAAQLAKLRRDLLLALVRLQAMQNHCGVLARSALAVARRTCAPVTGAPIYGPRGERGGFARGPQRQVWRSA